MMVIRYSTIGAYFAGVKELCGDHVRSLGMKILAMEEGHIGDCMFFKVENVPDVLPEYITISNYEIQV